MSLKISHVLLSKWIHILIHRFLKRRRGRRPGLRHPINHKFTIRDSEKPVQSEAVPFSLKHKALLFHHKLWIISKMADSTRSDSAVKCRYLIIMRFMRVYWQSLFGFSFSHSSINLKLAMCYFSTVHSYQHAMSLDEEASKNMVCFNTFHLERRQPNMCSKTITVIINDDDYAEYDDYVEYEKNHWQKKN